MDYHSFPQHKVFVKLCGTNAIKLRVLDVHMSKQALVIAKNLTDEKVAKIRLRNAKAKETAKINWKRYDFDNGLEKQIKNSLTLIMNHDRRQAEAEGPKGLQKF